MSASAPTPTLTTAPTVTLPTDAVLYLAAFLADPQAVFNPHVHEIVLADLAEALTKPKVRFGFGV